MKKQRKALTAACLLAFAATAWAAPETVVTNAPAAAQPVTVASAAPVAVVTVETVKDVNQFPAADQHPPVQKKLPAASAVRQQVRDYLQSKGISIGKENKGKTYFDGVADVNVNRASPDYGKSLAMAYETAYMEALRKFAEFLDLQVENEVSRELFTDNSTDARRFTADPTKTKLDVLLDKGTALAEAQIDNALRKLGTSESRIKSMTPVEKKTFLKKAISDETTRRASLALGGINIAQNFVSETDNGRAAVAVLLAYSPKMEAVAASLARGEKPMIQTCAVTGARLHMVGPMGFAVDDKKLNRAGLDYWHQLDITYYQDLADFFAIDRLAEHDEETLVESAMQLQQVMMLYESGIREIKTKLDILADESRISGKASPINAIKSRIKTPRSIVGKLKRRGFPVTLQSMMDNLNDIGGIRVICPFIQDIYTVADMLMRQTDLTLIEKKDYISSPKPNGYRSLHLILEVPIFLSERTVPVRIELQLRTIAMDFWASLEHQLRYKSNVEVPANLSDDLKRCADVIAATDEDMQRIAKDLGVL